MWDLARCLALFLFSFSAMKPHSRAKSLRSSNGVTNLASWLSFLRFYCFAWIIAKSARHFSAACPSRDVARNLDRSG